jgi:hypothetical protein
MKLVLAIIRREKVQEPCKTIITEEINYEESSK